MDLSISSLFFSIGSQLEENWVKANISLVKLKISLPMASIAPNAFVGPIFETINELEILGGKSEILKLNVFNGLKSIKILKILDSTFTGFERHILDDISDTIVYLEFEQMTPLKPVEISALTGGKPMKNLHTVKFRANLENVIKKNTLKALTNVTVLDFFNCNIEIIEPGAFDDINKSIEIINLSRNSVKGGISYLPDKLFDSLLTSKNLEVKLANNNWNCDCELIYFQKCLKNYPHIFSGEFKCESPDTLKGYNISKGDYFCDSTESSTDATTSKTTISTITTTEEDSNEFISQTCYDSNSNPVDFVNIKARQQIMKIIDLNNGSITVEIEYMQNNLIFIWFSQNNRHSISTYHPIYELNCLSLKNQSITIGNFNKNTAYTLCLSDTKSVTVSPFDCISFVPSYKTSVEHYYVWLPQDVKEIFIGLAVVGIFLSISLGVVIGIFIIRKYPTLLGDHKRIIRVNSHLNRSNISSGILVMPNEYKKNE